MILIILYHVGPARRVSCLKYDINRLISYINLKFVVSSITMSSYMKYKTSLFFIITEYMLYSKIIVLE